MTSPTIKTAERGAWATVEGKWERLFGDFFDEGISIEWHDFQTGSDLDWGRSFHDDSLEICLNFSGSGAIGKSEVLPGNVGIYSRGGCEVSALRRAGTRHQFITVEFSRSYLRRNLEPSMRHLAKPVRGFVMSEKERAPMLTMRPLTAIQQTFMAAMCQPPVTEAARSIWYQGKVFELMSQTLFAAPEPVLFCVKHKRLSRARVECVKEILRRNIELPPDLADLARSAGCSPFYLSRLFSEETGMTIPQFLRKVRIDKAAELLLGGKHNVTEAAMEVGYSSLSHFSRVFCKITGYCPALYASMMAARGR